MPDDRYMSVKDCAEYMGYSIGSIYNMVHARKIPHFKNGTKLMFSKKDIDEWMQQFKVATDEEIAERCSR